VLAAGPQRGKDGALSQWSVTREKTSREGRDLEGVALLGGGGKNYRDRKGLIQRLLRKRGKVPEAGSRRKNSKQVKRCKGLQRGIDKKEKRSKEELLADSRLWLILRPGSEDPGRPR